MVKVNLGGCSSFVKDADYKAYVEKALGALEVLENETGKGNDFLGWKHLPSETLNSTLVADCEAVRDSWKAKNVDLVVVIGIGGSYLGAKCALEALSHQFAKQLKNKGEAPEIVFAGQNLSEEYMCELMDLVQERNAACVVISKSGTTTEPAVAFRLIKKYLEDTYGKAEAAERIVAVTDKARGALKGLATQEGYRTFVIEDNVGGRFSVLTPVGILPIVLAGFDMNAMLQGALEMEEACAKKCECNPAVQYASLPYSLGELKADGTFATTQRITANKPFIMQLPNSDEYEDIYNIEGKVTFSAKNTTVYATTDITQQVGNGYVMHFSYEGTPADRRIYALNDEEYAADGEVYMPGSVFVANSRDIRPFEAYVYSNQVTSAPYLRIGGNGNTGIDELPIDNGELIIYDLTGRKVLNTECLKGGIYIVNGRKVVLN